MDLRRATVSLARIEALLFYLHSLIAIRHMRVLDMFAGEAEFWIAQSRGTFLLHVHARTMGPRSRVALCPEEARPLFTACLVNVCCRCCSIRCLCDARIWYVQSLSRIVSSSCSSADWICAVPL